MTPEEVCSSDEREVVDTPLPSAGEVHWLTPSELEAWVGLIRVAARLTALADGALRRAHGIAGRDYELLHHLSGAPDGLRIGELATCIDDSSSCISHRVNRLVGMGLVHKRADDRDSRARRVELTAEGHALLAAAAPDHVRRVRAWVIDAFDGDELHDLALLAWKLHAHLQVAVPVGD